MSERWTPKVGENYWFINFSGAITKDAISLNGNHGMEFDSIMIENGNCFRTRAEAEAAAEKVRGLLLKLHEPTTECSQLPKLTAEVFDRPDCPEWAKYAAVDRNGKAYFYDTKPEWEQPSQIRKHQTIWFTGKLNGIKRIPGKFDAANWQNSLIERPVKKNKLPEWCKPGEWVYHDSDGYYYTVKSVDVENDDIQISDRTKEYSYTANEIKTFFSPARLRPYNVDEIPDLPFEVTEKNSNFRTIVASCHGDKVWLAGATIAISTEDLKRDFTAKGSPCGVLEHHKNGEWVR